MLWKSWILFCSSANDNGVCNAAGSMGCGCSVCVATCGLMVVISGCMNPLMAQSSTGMAMIRLLMRCHLYIFLLIMLFLFGCKGISKADIDTLRVAYRIRITEYALAGVDGIIIIGEIDHIAPKLHTFPFITCTEIEQVEPRVPDRVLRIHPVSAIVLPLDAGAKARKPVGFVLRALYYR